MKKLLICLCISLGLALIFTRLENDPFYQTLDLKLYDLQMNLRTPPSQDKRIVFVEMDEQAIDNLGRWPWPRNIFANIVDTLESLGVKQILFDVTFGEPTNIIINKEATKYIFQEKKEISDYIAGEIGLIKGKETLLQEDAIHTLNQINRGFNEYTQIAESKLNNAITDNDLILRNSFKETNSFIGYSFEVITEDGDMDKQNAYLALQKELHHWIDNNPYETFLSLPSPIVNNEYFKLNEIYDLFLRLKLTALLEENIEISLTEASKKLKQTIEQVRVVYNTVKKELIKSKILAFLESDPQAKLTDAIYHYEIFDGTTQKFFKETWVDAKNEFESRNKFSLDAPERQQFLIAKNMEAPYFQFTNAIKGGGYLNGIPDSDGVLRYIPLFINYQERIYPHIALSIIFDLYHPRDITFEPGKYITLKQAAIKGQVRDLNIPIDHKGTLLINWAGRWKDTFNHISAAEIYRLFYLRDEASALKQTQTANPDLTEQLNEKEYKLKRILKNKICIIGLTAPGTHDFNPIPYESTYPMVGTHANVLNSILTEQFITKAPDKTNTAIVFLIAIIMGITLSSLSSMTGLFFTLLVIIGTFYASLYSFNNGMALNLASPLMIALFSYLGITSYKFSTEEKSKREIKNAFSKYVSPEIIEEIVADPSKLQLGGERKEIAVLFSDIRSFTAYSEKRAPEEVVNILNEYLDAMTNIIVEHKGTLDKYVGDEIMAIWGAPRFEPPEISSKRAVIAAVKMLERLKILREKWLKQGLEPLDIGIGINTGEMVVGNIGSELRMDYTVIGDAVNLGARVEALTRQYDAHLIITEATYKFVKDIVEAKPLEAIKVKGKDIPVMIYSVEGLKPNAEI